MITESQIATGKDEKGLWDWERVYFVDCGDVIKIGYTHQPEVRAKQLGGVLMAAVRGGTQLERRLHRRFSKVAAERIKRKGGGDTEFFLKDPDLLKFVDRVAGGEHPEAILAAEERAKEDAHFQFLLARSRGSSLWLQARVVTTYDFRNYDSAGAAFVDQQAAIDEMHQVERAWECLESGQCSCLCHEIGEGVTNGIR